MNSTGGILDTSQICFDGDFDAQVENILYHVRLTASEVQNLRYLFEDLEVALQNMGPGLQVMPFGSIVTGLGIKTSDVDCYVSLPEMKPSNNYVIHARNLLRKYFRKFTNIFAITTAKVPIVKFLHIPTNCNCDVNFKSPAGVHNSELIRMLFQKETSNRALNLAILIKYWSKVHKITGTNLLASYVLTLMVVFYLQLMNILPSVCEMQKNVPPNIIDNWNVSFDKNMCNCPNNNDSLYELVGGFFKCYGNLNFEENIISPYMGRLLNKKLFKRLIDVPKEYKLYKQNVYANVCKPLKVNVPMCVQDPFEHSRNSSLGVYPKLALRIKAHFQFAAKKFDELPPECFLRAILTEDPINMMTQNLKQKPKHVFHNKVMKHKHPQQDKSSMQNKMNLIRCYEQINKKPRL